MGMRVDLVDKRVYGKASSESQHKLAEDILT